MNQIRKYLEKNLENLKLEIMIGEIIIGLFMLSSIHIGGPLKAPIPPKAFPPPVEKIIITDDLTL